MNKHYVLPVIHHKDNKTTLDQANLAFSLGADGIFLISHLGQLVSTGILSDDYYLFNPLF